MNEGILLEFVLKPCCDMICLLLMKQLEFWRYHLILLLGRDVKNCCGTKKLQLPVMHQLLMHQVRMHQLLWAAGFCWKVQQIVIATSTILSMLGCLSGCFTSQQEAYTAWCQCDIFLSLSSSASIHFGTKTCSNKYTDLKLLNFKSLIFESNNRSKMICFELPGWSEYLIRVSKCLQWSQWSAIPSRSALP